MTFSDTAETSCIEMYELGVYDAMVGNFFRYYKKSNHFITLKNYFNNKKFVFECSCGSDNMDINQANLHRRET